MTIIKEGTIEILPSGGVLVRDFIFQDGSREEVHDLVIERLQKALLMSMPPAPGEAS
jgi:hypothetical protein